MAIHWLLLAVSLLLNNVISSSGAPADSFKTDKVGAEAEDNTQRHVQKGVNIGNINSWNNWVNDFSTWTNTKTEGGKCVNLMSIKKDGFVDVFKFPCSAGTMGTHSSDEDILIANKDTVQSNSIYGKKPNQLQVIQEGKCSLRTYKTTNGKTTASSTPVTGAKCDAMKKEHLDRMKKWQKWEAETFPPCFPFCNEARPGTSVAQPKPKPSSSATMNYNPGSWNTPYTAPSSTYSDPYTYTANMNYNPSSWNTYPYTAPSSSYSGPYTSNWDYDNDNDDDSSYDDFNPFTNQFLAGLFNKMKNAYYGYN